MLRKSVCRDGNGQEYENSLFEVKIRGVCEFRDLYRAYITLYGPHITREMRARLTVNYYLVSLVAVQHVQRQAEKRKQGQQFDRQDRWTTGLIGRTLDALRDLTPLFIPIGEIDISDVIGQQFPDLTPEEINPLATAVLDLARRGSE